MQKLDVEIMVKTWISFLLLYSFALTGATLPAKMTVQIAPTGANSPIQGQISILRLADQPVQESSFTVDGQPLAVTKVEETLPAGKGAKVNETLILSKYSFSLPGKAKGLYLFPAVRVQVGQSMISSAPVSFEVAGSSSASGELQLQARVQEKGPFYPGQKVTFQYLISFQNPIQLTKENLPLLEFPGFRTSGAPKIENGLQGDITVQIISQAAIALEPGTFNSGPSSIEGYVFGTNMLLKADAPSIQVQILPFPAQGKPPSFNGAIGLFYWKVDPVGNTNVNIGEKINLEVTVSGSGDFNTVNFPDLTLQNGFKDVFRLSDLAPVGEMKNGQKVFTVPLRPIVGNVTIIPSIQFSSFDPVSKTYVIKESDPIAITVRGSRQEERGEPNMEGMPPPVWPLEVQTNVLLDNTNIHARHLQDILLVYAALFLTAVLGVQALCKKLWLESKAKGQRSRDIILEAITHKKEPNACCSLLRKALLLRLYELGITEKPDIAPEELTKDGLQGEIRKFLLSIEQKRFMGLETQLEITEIINEASQLYHRMK